MRAREAAMTRRARWNPEVSVEYVTPSSVYATGRYEVPLNLPVKLSMRVAPVLADRTSPEAGLVLTQLPVVVLARPTVSENATSTAHYRAVEVIAWGADSTMRTMLADDWKFAVTQPAGVPVPAFVSSHLRALAYYSALPVDLTVLQRWNAAQGAVLEQVELLESVFGRATSAPRRKAVWDLNGKQVLRQADKPLAAAWCEAARSIAASSKGTYDEAREQWLDRDKDEADLDSMQASMARLRSSVAAIQANVQMGAPHA